MIIIYIDKNFIFSVKSHSVFTHQRNYNPEDIKKLAEQREKYRQEKNWQKADQIRKEIKKLGFEIEDTAQGSKIKKGC